jgi:hypothetical protein
MLPWHTVPRWLWLRSRSAQHENPLLKSEEMTRDLRVEIGPKAELP